MCAGCTVSYTAQHFTPDNHGPTNAVCPLNQVVTGVFFQVVFQWKSITTHAYTATRLFSMKQ